MHIDLPLPENVHERSMRFEKAQLDFTLRNRNSVIYLQVFNHNIVILEFLDSLHTIALNNMEKPEPAAVIDTAMISCRILDAFLHESPDINPSEIRKALEYSAWLYLTAAATHHVNTNSISKRLKIFHDSNVRSGALFVPRSRKFFRLGSQKH